jgi:hypothetical protein
MVALKTERRVYMWRLRPHAVPREAGKTATLDEIVGILKAAYDAGTAEMYISDQGRTLPDDAPDSAKDQKNRIYIADFEITEDAVTLLINRGDPTAADPAFINALTRAITPVSPGPDESQGWSAHLVISRAERPEGYRACFERMPRSTSSYTDNLIRAIVIRATQRDPKYTYVKITRPRGRAAIRENAPYRPEIGISKVPSNTLIEDLKEGEISNVVLVKSKATLGGIDAPPMVKSIKSRLTIKPEPSAKQKFREFISAITPLARAEGYDTIQIHLSDLPGNATASPKFSLDVEDATEQLYVRTQRLTDFPEFLQSCYAKIDSQIKEKILGLIANDAMWAT